MPGICINVGYDGSRHATPFRLIAPAILLAACLFPPPSLASPPIPPSERPQGSILCWGSVNYYGQCEIPSPNGGFTAVAAGDYHSLGLKVDGSVVGWGTEYFGEASQIPAMNSKFTSIAAGPYSSLGLRADGAIVHVSRDTRGAVIPGDFIGIAVDEYHAVGVRADGSMQGWDCWICGGKFGCFNTGACDFPPPNTNFVAVAANWGSSLGLKADGSIVRFPGAQSVFPADSGFIAIAAADSHNLGLKGDGSVVPWGCNHYRNYVECNIPNPNSDFISIDAADGYNLGLKADGSIVAWGDNTFGQLNIPTPNAHFIGIAAGPYHSLAIRGSPADWDDNGRIDGSDHAVLGAIINSGDSGPGLMPTFRAWYLFDLDDDHDVDLSDFAMFVNMFTGE